jgi:ferredoxin-type protein NapG
MQYSRRQFFTNFGKAIGKAVVPEKRDPPAKDRPLPLAQYLRPPGAIEESEFLQKCSRCTDCIEACPYDSIRRLGPEFGENAATPAIIPHESPCYLCEDMPCIAACKTEALIPIAQDQVKMGLAQINHQECYQAMGQPCDYCVLRCPLRGKAIAWDEQGWPQIDKDQCAGCGACAYLCPNDAITIHREPPAGL